MTITALDVAVIGAGTMGSTLMDCLEGDERWRCTAVHDDGHAGGTIRGLPVLGTDPEAFRPGQRVLIAIGDPATRRAIVERLQHCDLDWQTFIDRRALVARGARLGRGTLVLAFAMVGTGVTAGPFCVMSAYTRVGDGSRIGSFTSIMPGSSVGDSTVGDECLLGLNSTCLAGAVLGDRVTLTPSTLVRRPVPAGAMVAGNPARVFQRSLARASISVGRSEPEE